jgi:hypothetical protein
MTFFSPFIPRIKELTKMAPATELGDQNGKKR